MAVQTMKEIRLIVSDVDGTLVNNKKKITPGTMAAVTKAQAAGIRFAIASGRAWGEMDEILTTLPMVEDFICSNGALVVHYHEGKETTLFRESFSREQTKAILMALKDLDVYTEAYSGSHIYGEEACVSHFSDYVSDTIAPLIMATRQMVPHMVDYVLEKQLPIEKVQIFYGTEGKKQQAKRLVEALGMFTVIESSEGNLEFVLPQISKGRAVKALADSMGITAEQVMTIGDSNNDLSMLTYAGTSFAMASGEDTAKQAAKYITASNEEDGVAQAIYTVLARRGK